MSYKNPLNRDFIRLYWKNKGVTPHTRADWDAIKKAYTSCAYCGKPFSVDNPATKEHLVGINADELGSDHGSNILPAHKACQIRTQTSKKKKIKANGIPEYKGLKNQMQQNWENQVKLICTRERLNDFQRDLLIQKIKKHIENYPSADEAERVRKITKNQTNRRTLKTSLDDLSDIVKKAFEQKP